MKWLIVVGALLLPACAQQWAENDHASCSSYGWQPGTDGYAQCRQALDQQRGQNVMNWYALTAPRYVTVYRR